jgi:hypothetical protein
MAALLMEGRPWQIASSAPSNFRKARSSLLRRSVAVAVALKVIQAQRHF